MNFSQALERIKWGQPMSRRAWGSVSTYVYRGNPPDASKLFLRSGGGASVWFPSSDDVMADDWFDVVRID